MSVLSRNACILSKLLHFASFMCVFHLRLRIHLHQRRFVLQRNELLRIKKLVSNLFSRKKSESKSFLIAIESLPSSSARHSKFHNEENVTMEENRTFRSSRKDPLSRISSSFNESNNNPILPSRT